MGRESVTTSRLIDEPNLERDATIGRTSFSPHVTATLVTADDRLPFAHQEEVARLGATVATIDGRWVAGGYADSESWKRETVHRWAQSSCTPTTRLAERSGPP